MKVSKSSWHYSLVEHKAFVKNLKPENTDAMSYIMEVFMAVFLFYLSFPLLIILIISTSGQFHHEWFSGKHFLIFGMIGMGSPIWLVFLTIMIEPFMTKKWRKLEVID